MAQIKLKRIVSAKDGAEPVIAGLLTALAAPIAIHDIEGHLLLGAASEDPAHKYPVELGGKVLGWVSGGEQAATVAAVLTHLAAKEAEIKTLANEVLDRYREINLLYNISEKLTASLELGRVAAMALQEASRLIRATSAAVMLLNDRGGELETAAAFGPAFRPEERLKPGEGIVGKAAESGKAEIVNDVRADARYVEENPSITSLICAPLKTQQRVIGVIVLASATEVTYTAGDLKLLTTLASQVAPHIENALLYEKTLREAREREEHLQQQIRELHIELDESRTARQVAEITETDYFQRLRSQAENLRRTFHGTQE